MLYFFTVWNMLLLVFHQFASKYFDLLYMSFITMTVGLYLSFVNPKYFVWDGKLIETWQGKLIIDITHVAMFLFALLIVGSDGRGLKLLNTVLLLVLYISLVNPEKVYMIKLEELFLLISMFTIIYYCCR
jgi:hypothetical protein